MKGLCCPSIPCLAFFFPGPLAAGLDNRVLVCPLCDKGVRLEVGEDPNLTWESGSEEITWKGA